MESLISDKFCEPSAVHYAGDAISLPEHYRNRIHQDMDIQWGNIHKDMYKYFHIVSYLSKVW